MRSASEAKASSDAVQDNSGRTGSMNNSTSNENTSSTTETTATAETATTFDYTETRVNWLDNLPRELRNAVYANALPADIVFHDGVLCSDVANILSIDRGSRQEGLEEMGKMREARHFVFEFTSNATMLKYLDALPDNSLESYANLTITVKGPYNGHSNIYSNDNGCHRTNISPTLRRMGEEVWFEVVYACPDLQFERLTGMAFTAGIIDLRISTHSHEEDVPHVRAYSLGEIWQPWKPVFPNMIGSTFNQDCLDFLYVDSGNDHMAITDGTRYALIGPPHGLGSKVREESRYLIL